MSFSRVAHLADSSRLILDCLSSARFWSKMTAKSWSLSSSLTSSKLRLETLVVEGQNGGMGMAETACRMVSGESVPCLDFFPSVVTGGEMSSLPRFIPLVGVGRGPCDRGLGCLSDLGVDFMVALHELQIF